MRLTLATKYPMSLISQTRQDRRGTHGGAALLWNLTIITHALATEVLKLFNALLNAEVARCLASYLKLLLLGVSLYL
jgi:hypothetical protein